MVMDVKKECMTDDMMYPQDPCELLKRIRQHEQMEVNLYREIARSAPSTCLRQKIEHMIEMEPHHMNMYNKIASDFGCMSSGPCQPITPPGTPPYFYTTEDKKE